MSVIPQTTCTRCHRKYSALLQSCPYCQTKKPREQKRTVAEADSAVVGTQAHERAAENLNWQMIFGTIIVAAILAAVIAIVSLGVNNDISASVTTDDAGQITTGDTQPGEDVMVATTAVPTATPEPTPVATDAPLVNSVGITYLREDMPGFTQYVGDKVQLDVAFYPINNDLTPEWSSSDETVATVDQTGLVTLVGEGTCVISVTVAGVTDTCDVISRG